MKQRCLNPSHPHHADYGGRGIKVCARWRESYQAFLSDMGRRPSPKHSIDRYPDNDGNYEPGNCRWATWKEQALNKRSNNLITFGGETMPLTSWARRVGVTQGCLWIRIHIRHWPLARALREPGQRKTKRGAITYRGETLPIRLWAVRVGIKENALRRRLHAYGWSIGRALTEPIRRDSRHVGGI